MIRNTEKPVVMTVDDTPANLELLQGILQKQGYQVAAFPRGDMALKAAAEHPPDLVLLDIMMPEMDGYRVCEKIKANFATRHIPVIFLTAKTETGDVVKGFEAGGVDYVTKPFNSEELLARVRTHVEIKILRGLLPICSRCKKIRDDQGFWNQVEAYFETHSEVTFTHSICPGCMDALYGDSDWYRKPGK